MDKRTLLVEGMMSILVLLPSTGNTTPKFITPTPSNIKKVTPINNHESFVEVGLTMRDVANNQLKNLSGIQQRHLKALM